MNKLLFSIIAAGLFAVAAPASATVEVSGSNTGCSSAPLAPGADRCAGYYSDNQFSQNNVGQQQAAINLLLAGSGQTYVVDWNALKDAGKVVSNKDLIALGNLLATAGGQVILGLHWGNVPGEAGNVSAFYMWDNVAPGSITLTDTGGYSNAVLYRSTAAAVPEPGTWALMLVGFGAVGASLRQRRRFTPRALLQAA
ncbi:PEPxxWA-CTERM sorting domain-containing protein [Sphingomonas humi]|uniref:Ice-binding protein C-terminal domain-containing protein n=1 Tax=Sphingomonas humi TaxID=335630 RepID=A0ABP7RYI6_9SPHN